MPFHEPQIGQIAMSLGASNFWPVLPLEKILGSSVVGGLPPARRQLVDALAFFIAYFLAGASNCSILVITSRNLAMDSSLNLANSGPDR